MTVIAVTERERRCRPDADREAESERHGGRPDVAVSHDRLVVDRGAKNDHPRDGPANHGAATERHCGRPDADREAESERHGGRPVVAAIEIHDRPDVDRRAENGLPHGGPVHHEAVNDRRRGRPDAYGGERGRGDVKPWI